MNNVIQKEQTVFSESDMAIQEVDRALAEKEKAKKETVSTTSIKESKNTFFEKSLSSFPQVMRWLGVIIIGVSAVIVMARGDEIFSPFVRHWVLVGGTTFLGILGLLFGSFGKDNKGARTFFGIGVALIPVLFSQLGAMIFSLQAQPFSTLPDTLIFKGISLSGVIINSIVTVLVSSGIAYFGFLTLARSKAKILTFSYLLLNADILIPCRDNAFIGLIILGQIILLWYAFSSFLSKEIHMKTFEGLLCKLMLFVPPSIIFARSLFYTVNPSFVAMSLALSGTSLFVMVKEKAEKLSWAKIVQAIGVLIASSGWLVFSISSIENWSIISSDSYSYIIGLPFALLFAAASFLTTSTVSGKYRGVSAILSGIVVFIAYITGSASQIALVSIVIGTIYVALGVLQKERLPFITGSVIIISGLGYTIWQAIELTAASVWITLSLLGIGTLVFASCCEMLKIPLRKHLLNFNTRVKTWR